MRAEAEGVVVVAVLGRDLRLALVREAAVEVVRPATNVGKELGEREVAPKAKKVVQN